MKSLALVPIFGVKPLVAVMLLPCGLDYWMLAGAGVAVLAAIASGGTLGVVAGWMGFYGAGANLYFDRC